ncbi:Aste57867_10088 [Aphanomyces stellatus]|uniref:Aste57867_10088 protein n=1 Tax=Aphanomyces stellatus TaxID=120398 RepID=A0A485KPG8_9STRA|nr:hypothetical protein As57867_010049 [Aphanomyces stellatus]VFT86964.1 Aste57867_10088 [Aphanomyces stellatus]
MVAPAPLLRVNSSKKPSQVHPSATNLHDTFRRSISAPTDRLPEEDRRFVRNVLNLRASLDETSTNLHATTQAAADDDDGWGWFEDIDDVHVVGSAYKDAGLASLDAHTSLYSSEIQPQRQIWKSFPPVHDMLYEPSFAAAGFPWLACLSPSRPMAARIQIQSFRIVEGEDGYDRHAEYGIQCWIGDASRTVWKRFSAFKRFAYTLKTNGSRRTLRAWSDVLARSSWFRSLDVTYLHQMCCLLETFAQVLLLEAQSPYLLARFMDAE